MSMLVPRSFPLNSAKHSVGSPSRPSTRLHELPPTTSRERSEAISAGCAPTDVPPASYIMTKAKGSSSNPVVIPVRQGRDGNQRHHIVEGRRHNSGRGFELKSRDQHSQVKPSTAVTSLLANTTIPPPRSRSTALRRNGQMQGLVVHASINKTDDSEKEYIPTLGENPLDFLLCPPGDVPDAYSLSSDAESPPHLSYVSKGTVSTDSASSLTDYSMNDISLSLGSSRSYSPQSRGKRLLPTRKLEPLTFSMGELSPDHPLSDPELDTWELDFRVFENESQKNQKLGAVSAIRQKSAFKSNLTASLRALRSAAKSISNMTTPMITPDDFLTRSIITIDPKVPFTDERMPPRLDNIPTPELRRYLNPTTNAHMEASLHTSRPQSTSSQCTASIQMETYKISKSSKAELKSGIYRRSGTSTDAFNEAPIGPIARQRDMRENSDFIRVAVMEMRMRKNGKLAENVPGKARWALPPRRVSTNVYKIGEGGVPMRWIAVTVD